jgi:hypothetical protein
VQVSIRCPKETTNDPQSRRPPEPTRGLGVFVAEYLVSELGGRLEMGSADAIDILLPV